MFWLFFAAVFCLMGIVYQDLRDRMVHVMLYVIFALLGLTIQIQFFSVPVLLYNSIVNLVVVLTVLAVLGIYSRVVLRKKFINGSIGLGDILMMCALCVSFPPVSFLVLFSFSVFFALAIHLLARKQYKNQITVPLAGYMALFFAGVYTAVIFIGNHPVFTI